MIAGLIAKELKLAARDRNLRLALAGYLSVLLMASLILLLSFLNATNQRFSAMGSLLLTRISLLQAVLMAALTPWIVLRMHDQDLNGGSRPFGIGGIAAPWKVLASKLIATGFYVFNLIVLALPVFSLVRLLGAAMYREIGWIFVDMFLFMMVLATIILHLRLSLKSWLYSWILSYVALGVVGFAWHRIWSAVGREPCSMVFLLLLVLFTVLLVPHGNRALLYERN